MATNKAKQARDEYMRTYMRAYMKKWRANNPEKAKEIRDRYWEKRAGQECEAEEIDRSLEEAQ